MQNIQNIPGTDTDIDGQIPENIQRDEDDDNRRNDLPTPNDQLPVTPINEPKKEVPINENPREPVRIMSSFNAFQRRIF